jgi:hypothetical protein
VRKQPFLTGFPTKIFGSLKRSAQEKIRAVRRSALCGTLCELALMFDWVLPVEALQTASKSKRHRHYDDVTTFWAWLSQILDQNESCAQAVAKVQAWRAEAGLPVPSGDTSSYCTARGRLGGEFLGRVNAMIQTRMAANITGEDCWNALVLKALDGSSVRLMDTPENQALYPQPSGQKPGCGFPVMAFVGVLNLSHGGWEGFATMQHKSHDLTGAAQLLDHFQEGDLVLADRAFNSYELVALLLARGAHSLMRLHQARARKLDWRKGRRVGKHQRIVTWRKPARKPKASALTEEQWAQLPDTLEIRLIRMHFEDRGGAKCRLIVATTLLDTARFDGLELFCLYARRWEIELKLRDIKTTLRMEEFRVRTPGMAHKTLAMVMIAYNLLKALMQQAGHTHGEPPSELSFKGCLDTVRAFQSRYRGRQGHHHVRAGIHDQLLATVAGKPLDIRPFRHEPRAKKLRPKPYQLLTDHRSRFQEIPHRSTYRKSA